MGIYWRIIQFNFLRFFSYPYEIIGVLGRRIIGLIFLTAFWTIALKTSHNNLNFPHILSYFLIATAVSNIVMLDVLPFGGQINRLIKFGQLNNYMIRPINLLPYLYATYVGQVGILLLLSILMLVTGLLLNPMHNVLSFILFPFYLFLAILIAISFNVFIGVIAFFTVEASSIKNVCVHVLRVLSGLMVPLTFFPENIRHFVLLSPFPYAVFMPTYILQTSISKTEVVSSLVISLTWAMVLLVAANYSWRWAIKKYDAIGI